MFADHFQCGEAVEIVNAFWTAGVVLELVGVLVTLILTGSRRSLKNPRRASYVRGFFVSKHSPCSSAFLLLGSDLSLLVLDHGFLGVA